MSRRAKVDRQTSETEVYLDLNIDGSGKAELKTGLPFLEHMLDLWCRHGFFDLTIKAQGDLEVDPHHLVEDIGICLGRAWREALGEKRGIRRYGFTITPMDEALVTAAADLSGRSWLHYGIKVAPGEVGAMDPELFTVFWQAFISEGRFNLHLVLNHGQNKHHIIEAVFKAAARALREAAALIKDYDEFLSTKGKLE